MVLRSLLLAVCMVAPLRASACHCLEPQIADAYARSVAIAMVRIDSIKAADGGVAAEGEVLSAWKGDLPLTTEFVSLNDCDYPLAQGEYYLLFLERDGAGALTTGRCRGNRQRGEAAVSLHWLNRYGRRASVEYPKGDPPTPWSVRLSPDDGAMRSVEPVRADSVRTEPGHDDAARTDSGRADAGPADARRADSAHADLGLRRTLGRGDLE